MDREQATEDIKEIRSIMAKARRVVRRGGGGWIFLLWGCIWVVGFCAEQFLPREVSGFLWAGIDTVGIVGTTLIFWRHRRDLSTPLEKRIGLIWPAILGHIALLWFLLSLDACQGSLLLVLTMALAYILLGLFTTISVTVTGLVVAAGTTAAYLLLPNWFFLTTGLFGGGALILLGLWTLHRWGN